MNKEARIKVAMICHYSTPALRDKLPLSKRVLECLIHRYLLSKRIYSDYGQWNQKIINGLSSIEEFELYVLCPHSGLRPKIYRFENNNVKYFVFRGTSKFPLNYLDRIFKLREKSGFKTNRKIIREEIEKINPNIVLLIGAENPYYSTSILDIHNRPIFLHCQTVYANPDRKKLSGSVDSYRWMTEVEIFKHLTYFACNNHLYFNLVKHYNPNAIIFKRKWPSSRTSMIEQRPKKYDFVFWAQYLSKKKGFDNALEAISIVKKSYPDVTVLVIGAIGKDGMSLVKRIKLLGIENNIDMQAPIESHTTLLETVSQAKFALLPIKMDFISGTIIEAMRLGLPIVTFRTSGTPTLNKYGKTVLLADIDDNITLANNMISLMETPSLSVELKQNMAFYISKRDKEKGDNIIILQRQIISVINHFRNHTPIPQELLFNPEKDD